MQSIAHNGLQDLADILEQSVVLDITDNGTLRQYTIEFSGQDILLIATTNGDFYSIYPAESFDDECGGSVQDHARAINAEADRLPVKGDAAREDFKFNA